jgi:hypothetical protein
MGANLAQKVHRPFPVVVQRRLPFHAFRFFA